MSVLRNSPTKVDQVLYEAVKVKIPQAIVRFLGSVDEMLNVTVKCYNTTAGLLFLIVNCIVHDMIPPCTFSFS